MSKPVERRTTSTAQAPDTMRCPGLVCFKHPDLRNGLEIRGGFSRGKPSTEAAGRPRGWPDPGACLPGLVCPGLFNLHFGVRRTLGEKGLWRMAVPTTWWMITTGDGRLGGGCPGWWCDNPCGARTLGDPRGFVLIDLLPRVSYCGGWCCRFLPGFGAGVVFGGSVRGIRVLGGW